MLSRWALVVAVLVAGVAPARAQSPASAPSSSPTYALSVWASEKGLPGDVFAVNQDAEGYLYIQDRLKDMIVSGGENVYSGEVEAVLYAHPGVREAAVFGVPDPKWGELVMACVVLKPGHTLTVEDLIAHCRRSLASYKVPRRVELSDTDLPKSGSGKILKRVLRERFWAGQRRAVS